MHDWNGDTGAWPMMIMMLLIVLVVIGLVVWLIREVTLRSERREDPGAAEPNARRILDERFARGEIDEADYRSRRELLSTRK